MKKSQIALVGLMAMLMLIGPLATLGAAQEVSMAELVSAIDTVWVIVAAILVMFMQPGFALVEAGFTRAKNTGNIIMKNFMDFAVGSLMYWAVWFGLAY
jgi:Amt family ammonium transporter